MITIREDGRVEFMFYRPGVSDVCVTGDFDQWQGTIPMTSLGRGWWIADVMLPAGEFRFRYRAGGEWFTDFAAFGVEHSQHGWNSVLIVPESEDAMIAGERTAQELDVAIAA